MSSAYFFYIYIETSVLKTTWRGIEVIFTDFEPLLSSSRQFSMELNATQLAGNPPKFTLVLLVFYCRSWSPLWASLLWRGTNWISASKCWAEKIMLPTMKNEGWVHFFYLNLDLIRQIIKCKSYIYTNGSFRSKRVTVTRQWCGHTKWNASLQGFFIYTC